MKLFISFIVSVFLLQNVVYSSEMITNGIRDWLIDMRSRMPCGFPHRDPPIGPLAPFIQTTPHPVDINLNTLELNGIITNTRVDGLNSFDISHLNFNMIPMQLDFDFLYSEVVAQGQFTNMVGRILEDCMINGNGNFWFRGTGIRHWGSGWLSPIGAEGFLTMRDMTHTVRFTVFESNISGFLGTPAHQASCNQRFSQQLPSIIMQNDAWVNQELNNLLIPRANENLDSMTFADLLDVLINPPFRPPCNI